MTPILVALVACHHIDDLPVLDGEHCASDREEPVECVLDGDTVGVGGEAALVDDSGTADSGINENACSSESIRLLGVDAPEIAHNSSEKAECYGDEAASYLSTMLAGQTVRLEFDVTCEDKYYRTLAYAYIANDTEDQGDDVFINETIIRDGYALFYEDFGDIRQAPVLAAAQRDAESDNVGIWAECQ